MPRLAALALLTVSLTPIALAADEWPMFRGRAAGVGAEDPALPDTWSATENVAWKTPIPGLGWSSPVVWFGVLRTGFRGGAGRLRGESRVLRVERPEPEKAKAFIARGR